MKNQFIDNQSQNLNRNDPSIRKEEKENIEKDFIDYRIASSFLEETLVSAARDFLF